MSTRVGTNFNLKRRLQKKKKKHAVKNCFMSDFK